jgi:hypothetical protein
MVSQYSDSGKAFDPTDTTPAPQAEDESTPSNLRKAWDVWTSHPSNNAAMLQFGINMLQPRQAGQSGLGQFGGAIGAGAEASTRNLAEEEALRKEQEAERIKQEEVGTKKLTAEAYRRQVEGGGDDSDTKFIRRLGLQDRYKASVDFRKWLRAPPDMLAGDPDWEAVKAKYPNLKTKAEIRDNPEAFAYAQKRFLQGAGQAGGVGEDLEEETPVPQRGPGAPPPAGTPPKAGFVPPPGAVQRTYQGRTYYYDPITKQPYPGQ